MFTSRSLRIALALLAACLAATSGPAAASRQSPPEVRGLWVTRTSLTSPESIRALVDAATRGGFNTLVVQVRGRGDAYYRSSYEPRATELPASPSFDPLAMTIALAQAAGFSVHAWVAVNLVSSATDVPTTPQHIVHRQPDWLMVPKALAAELHRVDPSHPSYVARLARWTRANGQIEGLFASPVHPWAATHVVKVVTEIATRYAVDGLHLDYVRFPNHDFDYSRAAVQQFKGVIRPSLSDAARRDADRRDRTDVLAYPTLFAEQWTRFREDRLTALVTRIRNEVKAVRPGLVVSAAVFPDAADARSRRLQDWRGWIERGLIDVVAPMAYTEDLATFTRQIADAKALAGSQAAVWAGIGAYRLTTPATLTHIAAAQRAGAPGVLLFSYDSLVAPPASAHALGELGRAAFGGTP